MTGGEVIYPGRFEPEPAASVFSHTRVIRRGVSPITFGPVSGGIRALTKNPHRLVGRNWSTNSVAVALTSAKTSQRASRNETDI